jgi:hypothetical protein
MSDYDVIDYQPAGYQPSVVISTDIDYALVGGVLAYDPGDTTTVGIPPTYAIVYHAGNSRFFLSPANAQTVVAFKWDITDVDGGDIPVPTSITINLLDADGNALSPPVTATPTFDNHTASASTQTIGGRLTLPTPAEVTQVYYVQLIVWMDNGTGMQKLVTETVIRIRAY